jgi:ABC-2 type transport system ATP-binding protein
MLEIQGIQQWFRTGFWLKPAVILQNVSLALPEGSIMGFLGPNGAGKTSLIHIITGIRRPRAGNATWKGIATHERSGRASIGYLPERPYFHEHLSGRQLLQYFGRLSGMPDGRISERSSRLLARLGLESAGDRPLRTYSKGMLQRIGIAQALIHDPELLVLDEPMSGLDPAGRAEMKQLITDLGREGRTVFFSSHIIPDVEAICDRVALIDRGRILKSGLISELLSSDDGTAVVRFNLDPTRLPTGLSVEALPTAHGQFAASVPSSAVNGTLARLLEAGARIQSVEPNHASLETWFRDQRERT